MEEKQGSKCLETEIHPYKEVFQILCKKETSRIFSQIWYPKILWFPIKVCKTGKKNFSKLSKNYEYIQYYELHMPLFDHSLKYGWPINTVGFPGSSMWKSPRAMQETRFDPWVRNIPWRREWLPTPVCLPGKSRGKRSLVGSMESYKSWTQRLNDRSMQHPETHYNN